MKFICGGCLIVYLCVYIFIIEGFGGLARTGSFNGIKSLRNGQKKSTANDVVVSKQAVAAGDFKTNKSNGSFLSAWGIISLIMLVIVGSVFVYYVSIFYPLVCAKRGKYDVMEMTAL